MANMNDYPLYVNIEQAMELSGLSKRVWENMLNSEDPPPHLMVGNRRKIQRDGIAPYLESRQEVRL